MIRTRAKVNDTVRVLVPNVNTLAHLPPGTRLEVTGYNVDQPHSCLMQVIEVPEAPAVYNVVIPKGSKVEVHEE